MHFWRTRKTVLGRYDRDAGGRVVIDVAVRRIQDLYSDFDRSAPYRRKDLDQEFGEYLSECAGEVGPSDFVVQISLAHFPDEAVRQRVRSSIISFFRYQQELERSAIRTIIKRSIVLFVMGVGLLLLAVLANRRLSQAEGVLAEVFAQGLTVAAWVSLWEAIANLFLEWHPHRARIRTCERIIRADVTFRRWPAAGPDAQKRTP